MNQQAATPSRALCKDLFPDWSKIKSLTPQAACGMMLVKVGNDPGPKRTKQMQLHKLTIEALRHKATVASETFDATDPETNWCLVTERECNAVADAGTDAALKASKEAQEELENYLGGDMPPRETTAIVSDLCRAGWYEQHNPNSVSTRRVKTRTVEGVRYVTGF